MKPKFICDNCEELLKVLEEDGECFYSVSNHIIGMSQMKHNNTKNKIVITQEKWDEIVGCKYVHVIPKCSIIKIIKLKESVK